MSFKRFDPEDFVVSSDSITSTLWSTGAPTLSTFFTSSTQQAGSSGDFYLTVYQTSSTLASATPQFEIAYADSLGSGSTLYNSIVPNRSPSLTTYGQYRSLILEDENATFTFGNSGKGTNTLTATHFWVASIDRARYKESLFPGSINLNLSGSNGIIQLTDDSQDNPVNTFIGTSRVYQLISGSNGTSGNLANSGYVADSGSYGLVFPDLGTILLNPDAISQSIHVDTLRNLNTDDNNPKILYDAMVLGASFQLNSEETITSDYIFVRSRNSEFNYSENPSFISGSTGEVIYDNFINHPQVYTTTVGMYNDSNELIAVAKLSKPILKDFTKESLIRVKLDF
tara:strand:+ start:3176 stop:4198 length:1023 start_codon:yes stop_codon:yes gene_type:complete